MTTILKWVVQIKPIINKSVVNIQAIGLSTINATYFLRSKHKLEECLYGKWSLLDYLNLPEIINIMVSHDITKCNKGLKYSIYELLPLFY